MNCFLAQPTQDLTQYRESTQGSCVPKSSWVVMGNYVCFSVWIYHPVGQERLSCSGFSLRGCAPRGLARLEQIQALHGKTLASPLQRSIQILPASFPVGWSVPACAKHLLHLCLLTGQPDSVTRLYQLGILSGLGLLHDIHQPTLAGLQPRETWAPGRPTVFTGC